jgi:hypothetical protein
MLLDAPGERLVVGHGKSLRQPAADERDRIAAVAVVAAGGAAAVGEQSEGNVRLPRRVSRNVYAPGLGRQPRGIRSNITGSRDCTPKARNG